MHSRKEFLYLSGSTLAAIALSRTSCPYRPNPHRIDPYGIQLYTVRDVFEKDPKEILGQISKMGYTQIESYERETGIYWGMTNTEFKELMNKLGMKIVSSHCDIDKDFEKKAADAAAIKMNYLVAAWEGPGLSIDDYKRYAEKLNQKGAICKKNGIRFAFHNHSFSFLKVGNEFPQDVLMTNTDPALVDFEIDLYWAVAVGQDPQAWLRKYPNRFRLCHIKDRVKGSAKLEDTCDLGKGSIDFAPILKTARETGMEYFFTEQEHYPGTSSMESAKANAKYMKDLKI